jgi:hypothetical protein
MYGNATVTFTANNDTTIESFTSIPGSDEHLPWYGPLTDANEAHGTWDSLHQTIVWTEVIRVPGYEVDNSA